MGHETWTRALLLLLLLLLLQQRDSSATEVGLKGLRGFAGSGIQYFRLQPHLALRSLLGAWLFIFMRGTAQLGGPAAPHKPSGQPWCRESGAGEVLPCPAALVSLSLPCPAMPRHAPPRHATPRHGRPAEAAAYRRPNLNPPQA